MQFSVVAESVRQYAECNANECKTELSNLIKALSAEDLANSVRISSLIELELEKQQNTSFRGIYEQIIALRIPVLRQNVSLPGNTQRSLTVDGTLNVSQLKELFDAKVSEVQEQSHRQIENLEEEVFRQGEEIKALKQELIKVKQDEEEAACKESDLLEESMNIGAQLLKQCARQACGDYRGGDGEEARRGNESTFSNPNK